MEGKLHFWLREHQVIMEWYDLSSHGPLYYVRSRCQRLAESLRNLIDWFPIVWRDRDFDHYFFTRLLEFKLSRMAKYFRESNIAMDSEKWAGECARAAELLHRIQADDYIENGSVTREAFLAAEEARRKDLEEATGIIRDSLLGWWD